MNNIRTVQKKLIEFEIKTKKNSPKNREGKESISKLNNYSIFNSPKKS